MALHYGKRARSWPRVLSGVQGEILGSWRIENWFLQHFKVLSQRQYFEIYLAELLTSLLLTIASELGRGTRLRRRERGTAKTSSWSSLLASCINRLLVSCIYDLRSVCSRTERRTTKPRPTHAPCGVVGTIAFPFKRKHWTVLRFSVFWIVDALLHFIVGKPAVLPSTNHRYIYRRFRGISVCWQSDTYLVFATGLKHDLHERTVKIYQTCFHIRKSKDCVGWIGSVWEIHCLMWSKQAH
jgi:hypothetical protein